MSPRIGDFGLARFGPQLQSGDLTHMQTQDIIGTRAYMPPEAYDGEIAPRWDCYSLGVVCVDNISQCTLFSARLWFWTLAYTINQVYFLLR